VCGNLSGPKVAHDRLKEIGKVFNLGKNSSVSSVIERMKTRIQNSQKIKCVLKRWKIKWERAKSRFDPFATNGDSDSVACIAGSISGAYLGTEAIPDDWIKRIEKSKYLEEIAGNLSAIES
jgi:hypothetical protein